MNFHMNFYINFHINFYINLVISTVHVGSTKIMLSRNSKKFLKRFARFNYDLIVTIAHHLHS